MSTTFCHSVPEVQELYANAIFVCMVPRTFLRQVDTKKKQRKCLPSRRLSIGAEMPLNVQILKYGLIFSFPRY